MLLTRSAGVLLPVFSLPGPFGIGDLGPVAEQWIDQLATAGQRYWQVLPVHAVHGALQYSPYSGLSAFAGTPLLLSPQRLLEAGWVSKLPKFSKARPRQVRYAEAEKYKAALVDEAYAVFSRSGYRAEAFAQFREHNAHWLDAYAAFRVAIERRGELDWTKWPKAWRSFTSALEKIQNGEEEALERVRFEQFLFFEQWDRLHEYARQRGVSLIGDIPIYVHHYSADVWTFPRLFKLKKSGKAKKVAGVPPDYFSEDGQLWGNPVYDWDEHIEQGFAWWIARLQHEMQCFDTVRIDHFLGLVQFWEVDAKEETARNGTYLATPKDEFFGALQRYFPDLPFLAEDLGSVTDEATLTMKRYRLPGMKVIHFGFGDLHSGGNPYLPHNYEPNSIAYTGTHDNNTSRGWWRKNASKKEKAHVQAYAGHPVDEENVAQTLHRLVWQSSSRLAIVPYQDLLNLDERARVNQPGTTKGNWQWRMTEDQLEGEHWQRLAEMTARYGR